MSETNGHKYKQRKTNGNKETNRGETKKLLIETQKEEDAEKGSKDRWKEHDQTIQTLVDSCHRSNYTRI